MKIAMINEFSQAAKNDLILSVLKEVVEPMGHTVYNTGMSTADASLQLGEPGYLTYLNIGVQASLLLNSGAADFVVCGYCIEPSDAYLFLQINNGNALALPFAKGFGWGADVNLRNIFKIAFGSPKGMGYPNEPGRKESQNRNAAKLDEVKKDIAKPIVEGLKSMDQDIVKKSLTPRFLECFNAGCKDPEIKAFVDSLL